MINSDRKEKDVVVIPPRKTEKEEIKAKYRQKRVAAYCRVSTKQEEQLNSYETQRAAYIDMVNRNPDWTLVKIFADKGISGTSVKHREEFNKMIRLCKQGKVDMIITKSISRFARNTEDCLHYTRLLKSLNVDVYFEEQKIHSMQPGAEFYITIYGSIAQSESENISANVRWGKEQSAKQGKAPFPCRRFLGYVRGEDGKPAIDPEQAEVVRYIYARYLAGDSLSVIAKKLEELNVASPAGKKRWVSSTVRSILTNEKYKGDLVINKTYVVDCISKQVRINNGERKKYYVKNSHPAIIDEMTFARVQEEMARRTGKQRVKKVGTKTELGKYSGKYALSELLICGECKTPYRRCTWIINGQKKTVWRCINRLDYGKKYCHHSPTISENILQDGIMEAILSVAIEYPDVLQLLKEHIAMGLDAETSTSMNDKIIRDKTRAEISLRIAEIDGIFNKMIETVSSETENSFDDEKVLELVEEKNKLQAKLLELQKENFEQTIIEKRMDEISNVLNGIKNHPMKYDNEIVRSLIECIVVESKEQINIIFKGGLTVEQSLGRDNGEIDFIMKQ